MLSLFDAVALILVGALWGCTNPLLREGSAKASQGKVDEDSLLWRSLEKFRSYRVWLPYAVNQSGSLLYYFTLANSDLSLAVPVCNGLALVFSIITSYALGEEITNPARTILGSTLVVLGVAVCMVSKKEDDQHN